MTAEEAVNQLQERVKRCRANWEPLVEDSIGVIYGPYRDHDHHCRKCMPLIVVLDLVKQEVKPDA